MPCTARVGSGEISKVPLYQQPPPKPTAPAASPLPGPLTHPSVNLARLYLEQELREPECIKLAGGSAAAFSAGNPSRDGTNEDGVALLPLGGEHAVLAVADGVGGLEAGAEATRLALRGLGTRLDSTRLAVPEGRLEAIQTSIKEVNQEIVDTGSGGGTTLALAELRGDQLRSYHAGDSVVMVLGKDGEVRHNTIQHSPIGYALEAGIVDEHEAMFHEDRHLIFNMLGTDEMHLEVSEPLTLHPEDTVLLTTDGVLDNLFLAEIVERVVDSPVAHAARSVMELTRLRMDGPRESEPHKPDDTALIIWRRDAR